MEVRIYIDDGHPLDLKVARILEQYGMTGIFYIAPQNRERPVMNREEIKKISEIHEIGGHTLTHARLSYLTYEQQLTEIRRGKDELEIIINKPITKFSYPRGWYTPETKRAVRECGFEEARTMKQGITNIKGYGKFEIPVTTHFHPDKIENFIEQFIGVKSGHSGYYGLVCHSWEIEKFGMWDDFEKAIKFISNNKI